jgi:peptidoglycan/LPS O-acetylase OafA/YrhL
MGTTGVLERPREAVSAGRFYAPGLDVLRFFAFFSVFIHHNLRSSGGKVVYLGPLGYALPIIHHTTAFGLPLFFFLSAFLITKLLLIEKEKTSTINLRSFYIRRMLRIWPLYFVYLGAIALLGLFARDAHMSVKTLLAFGSLLANWYFIVTGMPSSLTSHLWSISVEEQFYLLWPGICKSARHLSFLAYAIGIASLIVTFCLASFGANILTIWLNSGVQAIFFAAGGLLALRTRALPAKSMMSSAVLIGSGVVTWFLAEGIGGIKLAGAPVHPLRITIGYLLVAVGCWLLLSGALRWPEDKIPGWAVYLGKISYGLYVFHALSLWAIPRILGHYLQYVPTSTPAAELLCTIALAGLSYHFLEKPFLRLKDQFSIIHSRPV